MFIFYKLPKRYFSTSLLLIMFYVHAIPCGGQQVSDNITDTTVTWINQYRAQKGIEKLIIDQKLNRVAEAHSVKMAELDMLSDSSEALGTPFERVKSSGLTDTNNLVVVAKAKNLDLLRNQLESSENISKILSAEMTHMGIGVKQNSAGEFWLTIHMSERAIAFTQFIFSQLNTEDAQRSITIKGNASYKKIKVIFASSETLTPEVNVDQIIMPQPNGDFEITLNFGKETGGFDFKFYVEKDGVFQLKNLFNMNI
jgi:nitrate reductase NapAB chaperone NapD